MTDQQSNNSDESQEESVYAMKTEAEPKSITNIYYDCLERIFDFLDLESLVNVAATCKRLRIAAAAKFGDVYGKKHVSMKLYQNDNNMPRHSIRIRSDKIEVIGSKFCFPFLRCFGVKISQLTVDYLDGPRERHSKAIKRAFNQMDHYIKEYCTSKSTHITIYRKKWLRTEKRNSLRKQFLSFLRRLFGLHQLETTQFQNNQQLQNHRPFKNVTAVHVYCSFSRNHLNLLNLSNLFPNLCYLDLSLVCIDENANTAFFPQLKHLKLSSLLNKQQELTNDAYESAVNFLHANPQLQSLTILLHHMLTLNEILNMINGNPSILKLETFGEVTDVNTAEVSRLISEHPLIENLGLSNYRFTADGAITFISQLNSLKQFKFYVRDQLECNRLINQLDNNWRSSHYFSEIFQGIAICLYRQMYLVF